MKKIFFQWIKYSQWLRQEQECLFLNQTEYNQIREFVFNKNRLTLIFCIQCYLECSGGYVSYHEM